ncbi:unnamed protein product [Phyllotreta striolata]|uniref:Outer dense fiber protein 3-like protein 2 n=1 Tax=Phyllotreta striolata TaxID=444603 RepID=A0A9N9TII1_PHYSR|nr:unnamed protein product [Phyllotreta striolata]
MPRRHAGPGPAKYLLPPAIGFPGHDFTKKRNPCYSMGLRLKTGTRPIGPGPAYGTMNMTRRGIYSCPAYSMQLKTKELTKFRTPGAGTYATEQIPPMMHTRPPEYSLRFRHNPPKPTITPGPGKYAAPTCIGPKVPDKMSKAAYSMSFKHYLRDLERSPGPANYPLVDVRLFKLRSPDYSCPTKVFPPLPKSVSPGPKYFPTLPEVPGYFIGLRTDNDPYITAEDEIPCMQRKPLPKSPDAEKLG